MRWTRLCQVSYSEGRQVLFKPLALKTAKTHGGLAVLIAIELKGFFI